MIIALIKGDYSVYFNYAQIALTLFGFTLLGTFFEHIKRDEDAIKKLVRINLWFLLSAIGFLIVYAVTGFISFVKETSFYNEIIVSSVFIIFSLIGLVGLTFGTIYLYRFLSDWYRRFYLVKYQNKEDEQIKKDIKPDSWIPTDKTVTKPDSWMKTSVAKKKQDSYVISGVDEAEFYGVTDKIEIKVKKEPPRSYDDNVPNSKLTRKTDKLCPDCRNALYNTRLDGLYFYCPKCKKQYHI